MGEEKWGRKSGRGKWERWERNSGGGGSREGVGDDISIKEGEYYSK